MSSEELHLTSETAIISLLQNKEFCKFKIAEWYIKVWEAC